MRFQQQTPKVSRFRGKEFLVLNRVGGRKEGYNIKPVKRLGNEKQVEHNRETQVSDSMQIKGEEADSGSR